MGLETHTARRHRGRRRVFFGTPALLEGHPDCLPGRSGLGAVLLGSHRVPAGGGVMERSSPFSEQIAENLRPLIARIWEL